MDTFTQTPSPVSKYDARKIDEARSIRLAQRRLKRLAEVHSVTFGPFGLGQGYGPVKLSGSSAATWTLRAAVLTSGELCVWVARNLRRRNLASEVSIFYPPRGQLSKGLKAKGLPAIFSLTRTLHVRFDVTAKPQAFATATHTNSAIPTRRGPSAPGRTRRG